MSFDYGEYRSFVSEGDVTRIIASLQEMPEHLRFSARQLATSSSEYVKSLYSGEELVEFRYTRFGRNAYRWSPTLKSQRGKDVMICFKRGHFYADIFDATVEWALHELTSCIPTWREYCAEEAPEATHFLEDIVYTLGKHEINEMTDLHVASFDKKRSKIRNIHLDKDSYERSWLYRILLATGALTLRSPAVNNFCTFVKDAHEGYWRSVFDESSDLNVAWQSIQATEAIRKRISTFILPKVLP